MDGWMLLWVATSNNDRWSPDQILKEPSLIYILPWVYVLHRWQQSEGTRSFTFVKALDLVIICALSAITELMTCICPYYSPVSFMLLQQRFGITGVPAGVLAWEWYQGCCTSQNKIVYGSSLGGCGRQIRGWLWFYEAVWRGGWTDVVSYSWQSSDTHLLWLTSSPPTHPPRLPAVRYPVDLSWMKQHFTSELTEVSAIEHGVKKTKQGGVTRGALSK